MTVRDPSTLRALANKASLDGIVDCLKGLFSYSSSTGLITLGAAVSGTEWTVLASYTDSGATSRTITLSGITGYTNFQDLKLSIRRIVPGTDDKQMYMQFNGDTGANYNTVVTGRSSGGIGVESTAGATQIVFGSTAAGFAFGTGTGEVGEVEALIADFQDTTKYKNVFIQSAVYDATPGTSSQSGSGTWKNANAITSIKLSMEGGGTYSALITLCGRRGAT